MDNGCLYADWLLTVLLTVFAIAVYCIPRERYHPMIIFVLGLSFFSWPFQFYFLEYGSSALRSTGHADLVLLLIPLMALGAVMLMWCLRFLIVFVLTALLIQMVSQTHLIDVSIPVSLVIAAMVWTMVWFSAVSNVVHTFTVAVYTSTQITLGLGSMILETSTPIDFLPLSCQSHFNMWLTCDVDCGGLVVYDVTGARIGWASALLLLIVVKLLLHWICTDAFFRRPKLKTSFCCCDLLKYNDDDWISLQDRKRELAESEFA